MTKAEAQNNNALPHDLILEGRGKLTVTGVRLSVRKIVPPGSEYLIALSNRFTNTCRSRAGSAQTGYGSGGSE